ncbi:MAG: helicase-related protein [Candidatus Spyradenecus sp.]
MRDSTLENPKPIDNVSCRLGDDIAEHLVAGASVYVASTGFSLSAFEHLAEELERVKEVRFVFTTPAFQPQSAVKERIRKERREFFIPGVGEMSLLGTEYEIRLRNRLMQKAVAKRCGDWIRKGNVKFASVAEFGQIQDMFIIETEAGSVVYLPFSGFTADTLGYERGQYSSAISTRMGGICAGPFRTRFEEVWRSGDLRDVTEQLSDYISNVYRDNEPELVYFLVLKCLFEEALKDFNEDTMPNAAIGYEETLVWKKLFDFQRDAAIAIINKLERYSGCILADSVGLGKTFTALAVIRYYELRNKNVLVLCPKKLEANWNVYNKPMYRNNPFASERLRYDVLCHTDIQRERGQSNGLDLSKVNWGGYDLVVIDESHNFRNDKSEYLDRETRYQTLMRKVMREGVKTKVLMLSATPVNNRFNDLKNQLRLAYGGGAEEMNRTLGTGTRTVAAIFGAAESAFKAWTENNSGPRTAEALFKTLPLDFLELLDAVTIARSRKHIERFYDTAAVGKFPEHLPAQSEQCPISTDPNAVTIRELNDALIARSFCVYTPTKYILPSRKAYYDEQTVTRTRRGGALHQEGREYTLKNLMVVNVLKRLESSVFSFRKTLTGILAKNEALLKALNAGGQITVGVGEETAGLEDEDEVLSLSAKLRGIDVKDLDVASYRRDLEADIAAFKDILSKISAIDAVHDAKLRRLRAIIAQKATEPFNEGNRKVLVFSAFADTASYLYGELAPVLKEAFGLACGIVTGKDAPAATIKLEAADFQEVLSRFSPVSKERPEFNAPGESIDILFGTDCLSEGQNLQDCDCVVNYDIHWNPVRIIQRFGRVDRIGSKNTSVKLVNFWPDINLNEYINLTDRVKNRMQAVNIAGTGYDNPLAEGDDVGFRDEPLGKMKNGEIIDMESLKTGVSITDLGLNEYALALKQYMEGHASLSALPPGIHTVVEAKPEAGLVPGVVFFLRNRDERLKNAANYFHPFYAVYLASDGTVAKEATQGKQIIELLRKGCEGKSEPLTALCKAFNRETKNGFKMDAYSDLLSKAIETIAEKKAESDVESLFSATETSALAGDCAHLDSFELIAFFVIRA